MHNELAKNRMIEAESLNSEFYFESLLAQAYEKGLFTDGDIKRIQYECLGPLADKTKRYNAGDSSSIRVEKAQSIMASAFFTIGLWLKTYASPDDAVAALHQESVGAIYQKGRKRIDTMLASAKMIHAKLVRQLMETENVFYRATIQDGINGFFKCYDPDYAAQEIHITADYPLYNPAPKLAGIEFIKAYLGGAYYENRFCNCFAAKDIHYLMRGYEETYPELLFNIYEPVLSNALGCVIIQRDVRRLDISAHGAKHLHHMFTTMPKAQTGAVIRQAAAQLATMLALPQGVEAYMKDSLPQLIGKIKIAAREQILGQVFFTPSFSSERY